VILKHATNININFKNNVGNTPLHLAAMNNDLIMISLLLNYYADKYAMNDQGETPYNIGGVSDDTSLYITEYHPPPVLQVSPRVKYT
jgi:ankyrin repeat protein